MGGQVNQPQRKNKNLYGWLRLIPTKFSVDTKAVAAKLKQNGHTTPSSHEIRFQKRVLTFPNCERDESNSVRLEICRPRCLDQFLQPHSKIQADSLGPCRILSVWTRHFRARWFLRVLPVVHSGGGCGPGRQWEKLFSSGSATIAWSALFFYTICRAKTISLIKSRINWYFKNFQIARINTAHERILGIYSLPRV